RHKRSKRDWSSDVCSSDLDEVWGEKKNLLLASGELPDALFNSGLSDAEVAKYGANGTLLALNDLIEEHAPILRARLEERPDIRRSEERRVGKEAEGSG